MPSIQPGSLILLTGASGFLATHCGQQMLQRGFRVRGTVRSVEKGEYLKELYAKEGSTGFEYVIVEDVEGKDAFDKAVVGVDAVMHTASPFHFDTADKGVYQTLINPAVNGTLNLLNSAKLEKKISRVVITSSYAAILNPNPPVYTFTEKDWNTYSIAQVEEKGDACDGFSAYRASKTLAEKAAWNFVEENTINGVAPFDIATINPPLIFGPLLHQVSSPKALNTSVGAFYAYLTGAKEDKDANSPAGCYVDVRDVAQLHLEALVTPDAGNKRFAVNHESFVYQPLLDILHAPENAELLASFPKAIRGIPGLSPPEQNILDASRAKEMFNWTPISRERTVLDMAKSLAERQSGW